MSVTDDGSVDVQTPVGDARAREPSSLATLIAEQIAHLPADSRQAAMLRGILDAHHTNQNRRAAVLKHPGLTKRLAACLELARPAAWTGYIPPHIAVDDGGGILRTVTINRDGSERVRFNQLGKRSCGLIYNDTPQRAELLAISAEAWHRENGGNGPIT
jgi:hypothetical protein